MSGHPNSFTVQERIILHLNRYNGFRDHYLTPDPITQQGIAQAVGIARNHVPRAINSLKQDAFVIEKRARVNGSDMKKKVYFLSEKGLDGAKTLKMRQDITSSCIIDIPTTPDFVGRTEEIETLNHLLTSKKRTILVTGELGIGKTYLVSKVAGDLAKEKGVFWHNISETDTLRSLLRNLAEFQSRRGSGLLGYHLVSTSVLVPEETFETLKDILTDTVLILDDLDEASEEIQEFLGILSDRSRELDNVRLILTGKSPASLSEFSKAKNHTSIELKGLDKESVSRLLKKRGFKDIGKIFKLTQAHPFFLKILQSTSAESKDLQGYLEKDLWRSLSEAEIKVMQLLSIHTGRVELDFLFIEKGVDYQDVVNLVKKGIVQESDDQSYDTHEILKEFFYSTIKSTIRKRMHFKAAKKLLRTENPAYWLDALRHLLKAEKQKDCAQEIVDKGLKLTKRGFTEDLEYIVNNFEEKTLEDGLWADVLFLRGYLHKLSGQWEAAMNDYYTALKIFEKAELKEKQADAWAKLGRIFLERGQFDESLEKFEKALALLENDKSSIGARIYDELGTIHLRKGRVDEARKSIDLALKISSMISDHDLEARINNTLGNFHLTRENWGAAEKAYVKCLYFLEDKDEHMAVIVINNLAIVNYKKEDIPKALDYWEEAARKAEEMKSLSVMLTFSNLGSIYYTIGDWKKAVHHCNKALEISEHIGKDIITAASRSVLGHIALHRGKNDWLENYEIALKMREKLGDKKGQASSHNDLAIAYMMSGKVPDATSHAENAKAIGEEIDNKEEITRSYLNLGKIAAMKKEMGDSKEYLRLGLGLARQTDNKVFQGIVYRDISQISTIEGEYFVAERYLKESVEILEKANRPFELGQSLYEYGRVIGAAKVGNPDEYRERSKDIFRSLGLPEVPSVLKILA